MFEDWFAITQLAYTYAELLDAGDHAAVGRLLAHGQVRCFWQGEGGDVGTPHVGADGVQGFYDGMVRLYDGNPRTRHVITNMIVELGDGGRTARTRSLFQCLQQTPELPLQIISSGHYDDSFEKLDGQWRFTEKRITSDYPGDLSRHGKYEVFERAA